MAFLPIGKPSKSKLLPKLEIPKLENAPGMSYQMDNQQKPSLSLAIPSDTSSSSAPSSSTVDNDRTVYVSGRTPSAPPRPPKPQDLDLSNSDIQESDLIIIDKLGEGAGGSVVKVKHKSSGLIMAKKSMSTSPDPAIHKQLLRELQFLKQCQHETIIKYYGAFLTNENTEVDVCMEYAEGGSLDRIYKHIRRRQGRTGEKPLGNIAGSVLRGLEYLHSMKIIHRVITRNGQVKLCDFGVSGVLEGSVAETFTGTQFYMAPERMDAKGQGYRVNSDVWSLGLTLLEVALNRYPYQEVNEEPVGPIELINMITLSKPPELSDEPEIGLKWSSGIKGFIKKCLDRDPSTRPSPSELLQDNWVKKTCYKFPADRLSVWLAQVWEWEMPSIPRQAKPIKRRQPLPHQIQQPVRQQQPHKVQSQQQQQQQQTFYNLNYN
ncbi:Pkinase-domain-containing protein [Wallemia mellicola]|nr:Pkinase-domain-containing protein [Wallemia mellicola]